MKALVLLLCLYLLLGHAQAFCPPRSELQIDSPNDYALALSESLAVLKTARDRSKDLKTAGTPMELIAILKTAGQEYECARSYVAPFASSKNEAVVLSAKGIDAASSGLGSVNDLFLERYKNSLDGKTEKSSEHEDTNARLMMLASDSWNIEKNAVLAASMALIEFDQKQKQRLRLTQRERVALISKIEASFPRLPSKPVDATPPLERSVVLLLNFLKDKKRKSRDEP